jgi:hypothetical protein
MVFELQFFYSSVLGHGVDRGGASEKQIPPLRYGMTNKLVYGNF